MRWNGRNLPDIQVYKVLGKREFFLKTSDFYEAENGIYCDIWCDNTESPEPKKENFVNSHASGGFVAMNCSRYTQNQLTPDWEEVFNEYIEANY